MNVIRIALFATIIALSGCATCERHPVACGVVVGVAAASVALSISHGNDDRRTFFIHGQPCADPQREGSTCY